MSSKSPPQTSAQRAQGAFASNALPLGTRIGEFEVRQLIGESGFGTVYLCYDPALDRYVAIKEFMPASLAARQNLSPAIEVKSPRHAEAFEAGMRGFINEARLLAQFDHPSLVKVYRFWQANGTAYMTMPYYEGPTLEQALADLGQPPDEPTLRSWLEPMLDALNEIHRLSCYHRAIAPDNILLTAAGPLLLGFGAARLVIGDMTQALPTVLKPGFAPIEQYGDAAILTQGAWTDLYALASVVYCAITGRTPMSAADRVMDDKLEPLSQCVAGQYSPGLLTALDAALAIQRQDRPQSVAAFRALMSDDSNAGTSNLAVSSSDHAVTKLGHDLSGGQIEAVHLRSKFPPDQELRTVPQFAHAKGRTAVDPPVSSVRASMPAPSAADTPAEVLCDPKARLNAVGNPALNSSKLSKSGAVKSVQPPSALTPRSQRGWRLGVAILVLAAGAMLWIFLRPATNLGSGSGAGSETQPQLPAVVAPSPAASKPATSQLNQTPEPTLLVEPDAPPSTDLNPDAMPARPKSNTSISAPVNKAESPLMPTPSRAAAPAQPTATDNSSNPAPSVIARCSNIRQRAGLEDLTLDEKQFLRTQCR